MALAGSRRPDQGEDPRGPCRPRLHGPHSLGVGRRDDEILAPVAGRSLQFQSELAIHPRLLANGLALVEPSGLARLAPDAGADYIGPRRLADVSDRSPVPRLTPPDGWKLAGAVVLALVLIAAMVFRDDVLRASLDPRPRRSRPIGRPPRPTTRTAPAGRCCRPRPDRPTGSDPVADVFFIHPHHLQRRRGVERTYRLPAGGARAERGDAANYAGPFQTVGRVFAPRYRQASLYAMVSQRDDAREARNFAYGDIRQAFHQFLDRFTAAVARSSSWAWSRGAPWRRGSSVTRSPAIPRSPVVWSRPF